MAKKIFMMVFFVASLVVINGQNNLAEAYNVHIGTYSTGYEAYIMTETISFNSAYAADATSAYCTIRAIKGNSVLYIDYNYWKDHNNNWRYSNSQGYSGRIDSSANISRKALYYILGH